MTNSEIKINHPTSPVPEGAETWDTDELQRDFEVQGFLAPYVVVKRRSDGVRGSLETATTEEAIA